MTLEGAQAKVIGDRKISIPFGIRIGVRQGDGLSATLFNFVLHNARSSQCPEKPGAKQHDSEQTNTNMWICR